jgi:DTW domain-containing protein YfiP
VLEGVQMSPQNLRKLLRDLLQVIEAQDGLLSAYRLRRPPSEKTWRALELKALTVQRAKDAIDESIEEQKT